MNVLLMTLLFFAQARPPDDAVGTTATESSSAATSFRYTSSTQKIDTSKWIFKGSNVNYTADPLVVGSCNEDSGARVMFPTNDGSSSYECRDDALMSEKLAEMLNLYLKSCAQDALKSAGVSTTIRRADLNTMGIISARRINKGKKSKCNGQAITAKSGRSCSISYHATGRAIDADSLTVTATNGATTTYPLACVTGGKINEGFDKKCNRSGTNGKFYDAFNSCMNKSIKKHADCADAVIDCSNAVHKDHVHISLPLCPKVKGIATS